MLTACLDSIAQSVTDIAYEVIVVLNDPTPALSAEIDRAVAGATIFTFRANLGFGGAVNFAARHARGDYIVLLNDDSVVEPGWLELLFDTEQRRPAAAPSSAARSSTPTGPCRRRVPSSGPTGARATSATAPDPATCTSNGRSTTASGGSLLIRKDVWDELGGFVHDYYPAYYEDVDFCLRAAGLGWEVCYQPVRRSSRSFGEVRAQACATTCGFAPHDKFVLRWSRLLELRGPMGNLEQELWKAMGSPVRVLVIGDEPTDPNVEPNRTFRLLAALAGEPDALVSFFPTGPIGAAAHRTCLLSIRVVTELDAHLMTDGVDFDVVIVSHPHDGDRIRELGPSSAARAIRILRGPAVSPSAPGARRARGRRRVRCGAFCTRPR